MKRLKKFLRWLSAYLSDPKNFAYKAGFKMVSQPWFNQFIEKN
ncbi:MAG: hypothetical protein ACKOW9_03850 [Candidatus Paceibacterota bacterium]